MNNLDALLLGIIQGLTEFLPVSSSGHLEIGKAILGDTSVPEESLMFTVVVHFATAMSTIVVFRKDILEIITGLFKFKWNEQTQFSTKIVLSMIPAVIVGLFFENTEKKVSFSNAFVIGVSQAIAMIPGISRSGATISTSVLLGNDKSKAARFSFLMVIPLILGKIAKDLLGGDLTTSGGNASVLIIGFLAAFVAGLVACTWMIKLVKKSKLSWFAIYCLIVGLIAIGFSLYNR